ncbi:MAG: sugar phosphate isomerase/epimerase [Clostridia bacterium]|nr:sugar phosphate isomerase/epimerase [Clostridia bacterium]
MLLSTQTDTVFAKCGADDGLKILAAAGYDALDYSMFGMTGDDHFLNTGDFLAYAAELKEKAAALGLRFNQAHAPFPCWKNGDEDYNTKMPPRIANAIRIAGTLGADSIVVHPIAYTEQGDAQKEVNFKLYRSLAPVAKEYGIKIALENMWGRDSRRNYIIANVCSYARDLCEYYDELDDPDAFTVCLDLGHCGLVGEEPDDAIRILGHDRLGALHIHDNNYVQDNHTVPYDYGMKMNWDKITAALGEIDYKGDFTYEADAFLGRFDPASIHVGVNYMASLGRMLMAKIDASRPAK